MQARSKMITVAILEVRRHKYRQWKFTNHGVNCVIARYTKARLNVD